MKKLSWNQFNDLWRNGRLSITTIVLPIMAALFGFYYICAPFRKWVDRKIDKILNQRKK